MTAPYCPSCKNSFMEGAQLRCREFNVIASPRTSQDCTDYEREPGSDDVRLKWVNGSWVVA